MNLHELSLHVEHAVDGPMWHGPHLAELLADVTNDEARTRPIPGAHTIGELVAHVAAWAAIVEGRIDGAQPDPSDLENFPPAPLAAAADWDALRERLRATHESLARRVLRLSPGADTQLVAGRDYTVGEMVRGVVEHDAYHGGQIALLKKLLRQPARAPAAAQTP